MRQFTETTQSDIKLVMMDLEEYKASAQGRLVRLKAGDDSTTEEDMVKCLGDYWDARNSDGLVYDNDEDRQKGIEIDRAIAKMYRG